MAQEQELTRREEMFCQHYTVSYNGADAARRAGYAEKSAAKAACRLLKEARILRRIREIQQETVERLCLSRERVVLQLMELADVCMAAKPVMEWDYSEHKMVPTGEYQVDSKGAAKALELLGKHLGLFAGDAGDKSGDGPVFYEGDGEVRA